MKSRARPSKDCSQLLARIVSWTAQEYDITTDWRKLFNKGRGTTDIAEARTMSMTVAMAAGIPTKTVAKAFNRTWQAVDSARQTQMKACDQDPYWRDRFVAILVKSLDSTLPAPHTPATTTTQP